MLSGKAMKRAIKAWHEQVSPKHSHAEKRCQQGQEAWFFLVGGTESGDSLGPRGGQSLCLESAPESSVVLLLCVSSTFPSGYLYSF